MSIGCSECLLRLSLSSHSLCPFRQSRQARSGQVRSGQVRSGQVRSGQVRSGQVRSGQVRSGQVRSGQVRSGQVRSGQSLQLKKTIKLFFSLSYFQSCGFCARGLGI
jgi:hypothetical protein